MVFSELKKLFLEKEYRIYLILVIWLIIGFTLFQFPDHIPTSISYVIFTPIMGISTVLFIASLFEKKELGEISYKRIALYIIIGVAFALVFTGIWHLIVGFLYRGAIISYIVITSTFYMYMSYKYGTDTDKKIIEENKSFSRYLRWIMFIGGTLISAVILWLTTRIGIAWALNNPQIANILALIILLMFILFIVFAVIGILTLFAGYLNAWLGIFFILVSIFTAYLMAMAFYTLGTSSDQVYSLWTKIGLYIFDLGLILYTISGMIGEKSEIITQKVNYLKRGSVIMWLLMSKSAFELAKAADPRIIADALNAVLGFILFIPLFVIASVYGIWNYRKVNNQKKKTQD